MRRFVLDLQDRRPVWSMPPWVGQRIRAALGPGWELVEIETPSDGSGDGAGQASAAVLDAVGPAEVYAGYGIPEVVITAAPALGWVHSGAAGVGGSLRGALLERDIVFTNSAGIHAVPMAETVLGYLLHFARGFDLAARGQRSGEWISSAFYAGDTPVRELGRSTVAVIGFGGIGREVARRVRAFGCRVLAVRRRALPSDVEGVEVRVGLDALPAVLAESDHVVLTAPATDETRGLFDAALLARMKPGAVLVNVARGSLVDEAALVDALARGHLRGAALDVFASEPLAADSPLWARPDVLITPHVSAVSRAFWERETALIEENVRRWLEGVPLLNRVDKRAGY